LREAAKADGLDLWAPLAGQEDWHELLVRDRFYSSPRAPRVVWLPCARDSISWFKPFELEVDEVWEESLLQALREYGLDVSRDHEDELVGLLPAHAREWFDKPKERKTAMRFLGRECERAPYACSHYCEFVGYI